MRRSIPDIDTIACSNGVLAHSQILRKSNASYWHGCLISTERHETGLTLTCLEARVFLVDDVNAALTADHAVVPVTGHQRFERVLDLHVTVPVGSSFYFKLNERPRRSYFHSISGKLHQLSALNFQQSTLLDYID